MIARKLQHSPQAGNSTAVPKAVRAVGRLTHFMRPRTLAARILWRWRLYLWNRQPGLSVSPQAYMAASAKLQLDPCGIPYGGQIQVAAGARIADGALLAPHGGRIDLGENVIVGPYCVLYGQGGLTIGRDTMIAGHTFIVPSNHGFRDRNATIFSQPGTHQGISIGEDVWIGAGVQILDGVRIGKGCIVGAGAVVNKSLPDYAIAVGVPARIIGQR